MEENKNEVVEEVVEETVVEEAPVAEASAEDTTSKPAMEVEGNKFALIAFILTAVGLGLALGTVTGLVGMVLGIVGLVLLKKAAADRKPFSVFQKVAKPLCIVAVILGAVMFVTALLVTLIPIILGLIEAGVDAALGDVALFF